MHIMLANCTGNIIYSCKIGYVFLSSMKLVPIFWRLHYNMLIVYFVVGAQEKLKHILDVMEGRKDATCVPDIKAALNEAHRELRMYSSLNCICSELQSH